MVTIRRIILFIYFLAAIAFILYSGIARYTLALEDMGNSAMEIKLSAEQYLFISIVISAVLLAFFIAILFLSRNIYRELDRISEPLRSGNFSPEMSFKRLGVLGEKINRLYHNLNIVNEGRSQKISSLNGLLSFFLNNIGFPLLVANIGGSIVYVSRVYCDKNETDRLGLLQKDIQDYLGEIRFADLVNTFEETRAPITSEDKKILFVPVYSMYQTLSEIVCIWDHTDVRTDDRLEGETKSANKRSIRGFIRETMGRKNKK